MAIDSINLTNLRNAEFIRFSKDLLSIIQLNDPAFLNITAQYDLFETATAAIDDLFKTDRTNPLTAGLEALDLRRDNALNGITQFIQAHTVHFVPAKSSAAKTLADHLSVFGTGITRESYQSETTIIDAIVKDWNTQPALTAAIATLGLANWITELETANKAFSAQYLTRTQQLATVSPDTIKAKRQEAAAAYYKLRKRLNSYYDINEGAEPFSKTIKEINALIDQYNRLINGREGTSPEEAKPNGK